MDEPTQTQEALNPQEEQSPATEAPTVDTTPADQGVSQEATQPAEDTQSKPEGGNRAQRRISDLSKQLKESRAEAERLKEAQEFFAQTQVPQDPWAAYESGEITMDQLKAVVSQTSEFTAQKETEKLRRELAQKEYLRELEADSLKLEAQNPRFNPKSPEYDQEYVDEMATLYREAYLGKPDAPKPSEFVARFEKLRARAEAQGVERSSAQLADQAAQSAVVGTGTTSKGAVSGRDLVERGKQKGDFTDLFKAMA